MAFVNNIQQDTVQQDTNRIPYQHTHAHTHTHTHARACNYTLKVLEGWTYESAQFLQNSMKLDQIMTNCMMQLQSILNQERVPIFVFTFLKAVFIILFVKNISQLLNQVNC